ncbi:MAG: HDOD domain-containing protein [Rhodocyclaceae bacterium]|nr:HDOD domain-containing protein [Rhodocyclaceae bacterium]
MTERSPLTPAQLRWGVEQWVAFLKDKVIPVMPWTRAVVEEVARNTDTEVSPRELVGIVFGDPFLALKLLRAAEDRRTRRLGRETTTPLASLLHAGFDNMASIVRSGEMTDIGNQGLVNCQHRAIIASSIARNWASMRVDISPEEVAMATLLAECGELLLWHFAPELPQRALDELSSGRAMRTVEAQQQACGFSFKTLTLTLVEAWQLPHLIMLLIRGSDSLRANLARLAVDTARHIGTDPENPSIPADIVAVSELLPGVSPRRLLTALPIAEDFKAYVLEQVGGQESRKELS